MTQVTNHTNTIFGNIRTVTIVGKHHFVAKDIAKALGYVDTVNAIKQHCKGVVKHHLIDSVGRTQNMAIIPESDVYRLIFGSKLPSAEAFQDWVFEDVLPTLRATGSYNVKEMELKSKLTGFEATIKQNELMIQQAKNAYILDEAKTLFEIAKLQGQSFDVNEYIKRQDHDVSPKLVKDMTEMFGGMVGAFSHCSSPHSSLQSLLYKHGVCMTSKKFNDEYLAPEGLVFGKPREVTKKGEYYGLNAITNSKTGETSPRWYDDRFEELLKTVGLK